MRPVRGEINAVVLLCSRPSSGCAHPGRGFRRFELNSRKDAAGPAQVRFLCKRFSERSSGNGATGAIEVIGVDLRLYEHHHHGDPLTESHATPERRITPFANLGIDPHSRIVCNALRGLTTRKGDSSEIALAIHKDAWAKFQDRFSSAGDREDRLCFRDPDRPTSEPPMSVDPCESVDPAQVSMAIWNCP